MDFTQFVSWCFYGFISFGAYSIVRILGELKDSVAALNVNLAIVLERTSGHEKQLQEHHERIREIEEIKIAYAKR